MPLTGNIRVKTLYLSIFVLLLVSYFLIFYSLREFSKQSRRVEHSDHIIYSIKTILAHLYQAESGARGFLLLHDSDELQSFYSNTRQIDSLVKDIESLTRDNARQQKNTEDLRLLVQERLGRLYGTVLMQAKMKEAVPENVRTRLEGGKRLMDNIDTVINKIATEEKNILQTQSERLQRMSVSIRVITVTSLIIALLLFLYSFWTYSRESRQKLQAGVQVDTYRDALEKKIAELQQANKELLELRSIEKFATSGRIARTIAHEIRNPLTNISLASEQIKTQIGENEEATMLLDMVNRNSHRINQMISELLSSTRFAQLEFSKANIHEVMDETLKLADDRIELKQIKVVKDYSEAPCRVMIDIQKMEIALLNIIMNAIEAMEKGKGVLEISTRLESEKCVIRIRDNGVGMNEEIQARIFEPYFTNKTKGTGLGLTNTQNIILNHKGSIEVESQEGKGTLFTVKLAAEK